MNKRAKGKSPTPFTKLIKQLCVVREILHKIQKRERTLTRRLLVAAHIQSRKDAKRTI